MLMQTIGRAIEVWISESNGITMKVIQKDLWYGATERFVSDFGPTTHCLQSSFHLVSGDQRVKF
jgi:hypothetical protein